MGPYVELDNDDENYVYDFYLSDPNAYYIFRTATTINIAQGYQYSFNLTSDYPDHTSETLTCYLVVRNPATSKAKKTALFYVINLFTRYLIRSNKYQRYHLPNVNLSY